MVATMIAAVSASATSALGAQSAAPCGNNLVTNGSFEQGPEPGRWTTYKMGSTGIVGWTITKGTVDVVGSLWPAANGVRSIDLDGVSFGGISQMFGTDPGKTYVVTFDFAGNPYGLPTVKRMQVAAAGETAQFSYDLAARPRSGMGWQSRSWRFVAKGSSSTLSFDSLDTENGYFGPVIDNVRVQTACD